MPKPRPVGPGLWAERVTWVRSGAAVPLPAGGALAAERAVAARTALATRATTVAAGTTAALLALENPADLVLRHRDTTGGRGAGGGQELVAGGHLDRGEVDTGLTGQPLHGALLVRQREGHDGALVAGASRAARPVQVVLVVGRRVDLQDHGHVVDVDASGCHVGCHQHWQR